MQTFKKDYSPTPDDKTNEFFLSLFYLLGDDPLQLVEEVQLEGKVPRNISSTFIALILK